MKCEVCHSFDQKVHADFEFIKAFGNYITIDQVRQLEHWVSLKAAQARNKVVIIEEIDRMTEEAANALLKTLEEPQDQVVFINITSNANSLMSTITSRCREVRFKPIATSALISYLSQKGFPEEKIELAAKLSQGVFGKAVSFIENDEVWQLRKTVLEVLKDSLNKPSEQINDLVEKLISAIKPFQASREVKDTELKHLPKAAQRVIEKQTKRSEFAKSQDILMQAIDFWWFFLRDIIIYNETKDAKNIINIDYFDEIAKRCDNSEVRKSWILVQKIPQIKELIKKNINPQLVLEVNLLEANKLFEL